MIGALFVAAMPTSTPSPEFFGKSAGVRIERANDGSLVETLFAVDAKGKMRLILASPTRKGLTGSQIAAPNPLLQQGSEGLFTSAPSFGFERADLKTNSREGVIVLTAKGDGYEIVKELHVPREGSLVTSVVRCRFQKENPVIRYLLDTYAFAPDGKPMKQSGRPDSTYTPGFRPRNDGVIGDHFFRAPVVTVQKGSLAASIMPRLDVLEENRFIPTIMDLDCQNKVVDAPLMSYGFCDYKLVGHVYFANDSSMTKPVPPELVLSHEILLDAQAAPFAAYQRASKYQWDRYGRRYLDKILPQAMPFAEYAQVCYPAAIDEKETGGWFETTIDGQVCGGLPSGWGRDQGWVSWQPWFNQLRSAWGLRWWGKRLGNAEWVEKSTKMLNLALAAPLDNGACPTTFQFRTKSWKGSLIAPDPNCYYDLTNIAWKGIWLLRWLEFEDCPRRDDILAQCTEMARLMMRHQNKDGSFPTWLTKDQKVVPILDHSAQTALPAWFLAEILKPYEDETRRTDLYSSVKPGTGASFRPGLAMRSEIGTSIMAAADFLVRNVVDQQRYYDFETFFSCSPKSCLQTNGKLDDLAMHDPHTASPPQNTLCMHWTAEALMRVANLLGSSTTRNHLAARSRLASLKSLDIMSLYQNVWPISYRKVAYTYGGFGVQNSDGEYNDARQAQFGDTLCDFGAMLNRRDYFERGVAAVRASMALINHPLHEQFGIYPNPNYPLGLQPENDGHGGTDHQAGRTGPDWGEMSGLTSMAWLLHKYGGAYVHSGGWSVGIDAVVLNQAGALATPNGFWPGQELTDTKRHVVTPKGIESRDVALRPGPIGSGFVSVAGTELTLNLPLAGCRKATGYRGRFVNASGKAVEAVVGTSGASDGGGAAHATVEASFLAAPVYFEGEIEGWPVKTEPERYFVDPHFDMKDWRMPGWTFNGDFLHWPVKNPRSFAWNNDGLPFIGTCEDGRGAFDDSFTGTITSPWFLVTKPSIRLKVGGGAGENVYVEILRSRSLPTSTDLNQPEHIAIFRGKNRETMDEVVCDVSEYRGDYLQVRIVDQEKGGWGHLNVGNVRCVERH